MKGFGIEIKNNLLEPKHIKNMGSAVWLYMYLIDKVTSITEDGIGIILGGRPITFTEVTEELGISQDTYTRWIEKLVLYPYITTKLAPHGIIFQVLKVHKRFRKIAERFRINTEGGSAKTRNVIKTVTVDSNKTVAIQRLEIDKLSKDFATHWKTSTGKSTHQGANLEKPLRKYLKYYTQTQILEAADNAGLHPYFKDRNPAQALHEENSRGVQDAIGELLGLKQQPKLKVFTRKKPS